MTKQSDARGVVEMALLETGAVVAGLGQTYTFASGIKSPIYTDGRRLISHPGARSSIISALVQLTQEVAPTADSVVGIATGAIPWAAWLAERLDVPLLYARAAAKDRGLNRTIEGDIERCARPVVIEDLVTTGHSCLRAVDALRHHRIEPTAVLSLFSYQLPYATRLFEERKVRQASLGTLSGLIAAAQDRLDASTIEAIIDWQHTTLATFEAVDAS